MLKQEIMGKLLGLMLVLLLCQTVPAEAKIDKWSDNSYKFNQIQAVYIDNIRLSAPGLTDIEAKNLLDIFWQQTKNQPYTVINTEQLVRKLSLAEGQDLDALKAKDPAAFEAAIRNDLSRVVTAYAKTTMTEYSLGSYVVPAHTEWRTRTVYDHYYDRDGKRHEVSHQETYPEYVPDKTVYTDTIHMRFDVYDAKTHKQIFSREEHRTDNNSTDLKGMFGEIVRGCLRDFRHNFEDED